jgi:signal transduction histidine kinase
MKVFQAKLTCWIALGFFGLMFVMLIAFNVYAVHEITHGAKDRLKTVSRGILKELAAHDCPLQGPIPEATIAEIDANLGFIARERKIGYAIVSLDYRVLHQTPGFSIPSDPGFLARERERPFIQRVVSEEGLGEALSEWHFMFRYPGEQFIIFTNDRGEYELVERLFEGFGLALVLAIVLALPSGYVVSRRVLRPLDAIDSAVQRIRAGDLSARIERANSKDELARLIDTLNLTFAELEGAFQRVQRFSADAAHELNTPLTAIRGNMEVCLGRERSVEEYQTVLAESVEQITLLSRLLRDLLLLARPGSQQQKEYFTPVSFSLVVEQASEQAGIVAGERSVRVDCEVQSDLVLEGSESLLLRLCYNLVHNAIRFSHPGSTVTVRLDRHGDTAVLQVCDHGIGIRPEDREKVFERFYQVDQSRNAGTGLGLSIVKWIVDLHGGRIEVESEPGCGTLVRVILAVQSGAQPVPSSAQAGLRWSRPG